MNDSKNPLTAEVKAWMRSEEASDRWPPASRASFEAAVAWASTAIIVFGDQPGAAARLAANLILYGMHLAGQRQLEALDDSTDFADRQQWGG